MKKEKELRKSTCISLNNEELKELKAWAEKESEGNVSYLIRQLIREYVEKTSKKKVV